VHHRYGVPIARAGVPAVLVHDLRHTSVTPLLAGGVCGTIVQERLGHSTIALPLDRSSHVTADMRREAAERLDVLLDAAS